MRSCGRRMRSGKRRGPGLSPGVFPHVSLSEGDGAGAPVRRAGRGRGWIKVASEKPWGKRAERGQGLPRGVRTLNKAVSEQQWGKDRSELIERRGGKEEEASGAASSLKCIGRRCSSWRGWGQGGFFQDAEACLRLPAHVRKSLYTPRGHFQGCLPHQTLVRMGTGVSVSAVVTAVSTRSPASGSSGAGECWLSG